MNFGWMNPLAGLYSRLVAVEKQMALVSSAIKQLSSEGQAIMTAISDLKAQVEATVELEASAAKMIAGIADQIKAAVDASDTAAIAALADELKAGSAALAAAVVSNTPAAPVAEAPAPVAEAPADAPAPEAPAPEAPAAE
jgi:hypothetical protein